MTSEEPPAQGTAPAWWRDSRFWFWGILVVDGFAYVGGVLCHRAMPFASRHGGYGEIAKLFLSVPFLYVLGPRHNLKSFRDPSAWLWNGLGYALPFFIALHWFYLQRIRAINYSLTWKDLSRMYPVAQSVFLAGGLIILVLVIFHLVLAQREKILAPYLSALLGAIALLAGITWAMRERYYLHLHHYFLFGFFVPFTRFRQPVSLVCQALCAAIYVEGVSEWSLAALWYPRP